MIRIAVVGDVHDQWQANDAQALGHLRVDLVLFVGDFGNESLGVVRQVAGLAWPKAVALGNHDPGTRPRIGAAANAPTTASWKTGFTPSWRS